jgi:hypothetical protein
MKGNEPAFPIPGLQEDEDFNGLTKREWFAGMAMMGELSAQSETFGIYTDVDEYSCLVSKCYRIADAMLEES